MSGRLTIAKRKRILANVLASTFDAKIKANKDQLQAVAKELYEMTFRKFQEIARTLPAGWVERTSTVLVDHDHLRVSGWYRASSFKNVQDVANQYPINKFDLGQEYYGRYPRSAEDAIVVSEDHPLYQRIKVLALAHETLLEARSELRSSLQALLTSCTNFKKLGEAWPEYVNHMQGVDSGLSTTSLVPIGAATKVNSLIAIYKPD